MSPQRVRTHVEMVEQICRSHGLDPMITLTSLSSRCFDSTVPLLFDRNDAAAASRARACFDELLAMGRREGFLPYRIGVQFRDRLIDPALPFWRLATTVKEAIDPHHIIAPGRYALAPRELSE